MKPGDKIENGTKKALLLLFCSLFLFSFSIFHFPFSILSAVHAQDYINEGVASEMDSAKEGSLNLSGSVGATQSRMYADMIERILGPVSGVTTAETNPEKLNAMRKNSAVAGLSGYIIAMYENPPATTALAIRDMGQTLGFIPKSAMAQGIGFAGLSPLLPLWKAFRNIAYALMAIVMIAVGFMVMFRKKIDPKTVVTVQNALPRIVITLLLITFSYAIVGVLIDLMYLVFMIAITLIVNNSNGQLGADTLSKYVTANFWRTTIALFGGDMAAVDDIALGLFGSVAGFPLQILVGFIIAIATLFAVVRILFLLLSAYIQIIIALLTAPLQLLMEAFPGSNSFSSWLKNIISHLAVFPITAGMMLIGTMLTKYENVPGGVGNLWIPPLLGGQSSSRALIGLIGLGIIMVIPNVAKSIGEALKAKSPVNAGPGAIFGPMGAGIGQGIQIAYQGSMIYQGASHFLRKPKTEPGESLAGAGREGMGGN